MSVDHSRLYQRFAVSACLVLVNAIRRAKPWRRWRERPCL